MNQANFISRVSGIVTGDYFLREKLLPLDSVRVAASGIPIGAGTAPTSVVAGVSFADGETAVLSFLIPQDYDEKGDKIALRLVEVPSASAADTTDLGITTAQSLYRAGAAVDATTKSAVAEAATASTGALVRENILNISGRGYKPGDTIRLLLDANGSGSTELILLSVGLIYGSTMRAYNDDDNLRNL